jgi:putative flippase GtrA
VKLLEILQKPSQFRRFLVAGALNTVASYITYLWMLLHMRYEFAYTLSTALAILCSYALNTYFVFRTSWCWRKLVQFPSVYFVQYVTGLAAMWVLVDGFGVDDRIAPWFVIAAQVPLTYVLSRRILAPHQESLP